MGFLNTIKNTLHDERHHRGSQGHTLVPTRAFIELVEHFERLDSEHRSISTQVCEPLEHRLHTILEALYKEGMCGEQLMLIIMDTLKPLIKDRQKMDRAKAYADGHTTKKRLDKSVPQALIDMKFRP